MEFGESNEQAAVREAKEETGLDILPENIFLKGVTNDFYPDSLKHYITLHLICYRFQGEPQVMEPEKCATWKWFKKDSLPENLMLPVKNFFRMYSF